MITFSRRYSREIRNLVYELRRQYRLSISDRVIERTSSEINENKFMSAVLRTRLQAEVRYLISNNYLERFLTVYNEDFDSFHLHKETLRDLSLRELGVDLNDVIDTKTLSFEMESYNDTQFLDLIEIIIIFAVEKKRTDAIDRINRIFKECSDKLILYDGLIYIKGESGIRSIMPLIKDGFLKSKLEETLNASASNYQVAAKVSASIIQYVFSSIDKKTDTKKVAIKLIDEIAEKITTIGKKKELSDVLNELVLISKKMSNSISDIRHTDKHTIPIDGPDIYKLIYQINLGIVELVVLTLPGEYILENKIEDLKTTYLRMYNLKKDSGWSIKSKKELVDVNDIPF